MKSKHRYSSTATEVSAAKSAPTVREPTHDEISGHAKAIWESHGRPHGQDTAIWFEAERRLRAGSSLAGPDDVIADTRAMLGEPTGTIEDRLEAFGEQFGSRSATSL